MAVDYIDRVRAILPPGLTIAGPLGMGGQATVFRGVCNGADAAIKVFNATADERRVDREIDFLSKMTCPYIVRLLRSVSAVLDHGPVRILAYEFHSGGDLSSDCTSPKVLPADEVVQIGKHISTAVEALWSQRIVHRDIKPANIVRASDGRYILVDVGFARHLDRSDLTVGGSPGTRGYRSPEQARGRKSLTIHSDVFSLGVTLFSLATKTHPFGGRDLVAPIPLDTAPLATRGDFPPTLVDMIRQMLDFTPAKRPTDMAARFAALGGG